MPPVTLSWIKEGEILEYKVSGIVTQEDMVRLLDQEPAFYAAATIPQVHALADYSDVIAIPTALVSTLFRAKLLSKERGHLAIVAAPSFVKMIAGTLARVLQRRNHTFHATREEALEVLCQKAEESRQ